MKNEKAMKNLWQGDAMRNGMLGLVVGDALGNPVQFLSREEVQRNPITTMTGGGCFYPDEGTWTDDSSLALATLNSLNRKETADLKDIAEHFCAWLYEGRFTPFGDAFDIGGTCREAIENYHFSRNVDTCGLQDVYSNGNGSLMRIAPLCIAAGQWVEQGKITLEEGVEMVEKGSALTHAHTRARLACGLYFFLVREVMLRPGEPLRRLLAQGAKEGLDFYRNQGSEAQKSELEQYYGWLDDLQAFSSLPQEDISSSGYVVDTFQAALWSLLRESTLEATLLRAVNLGDDADSVGAVTGGLAGLYYGAEAIPASWLEKLQSLEKVEELCAGGTWERVNR